MIEKRKTPRVFGMSTGTFNEKRRSTVFSNVSYVNDEPSHRPKVTRPFFAERTLFTFRNFVTLRERDDSFLRFY